MDLASRSITLTLFLLIVVVGGSVALQIFLSKRQSKWLGLILPCITLFYSLLMIFSLAVYDTMSAAEIAALILPAFFMANIPTIILVGIYAAYREKLKRSKEIDRMNIQDLE